MEILYTYLTNMGVTNTLYLNVIVIAILLLVVVVSKLIVDSIVLAIIHRVILKTKAKWDDFFLERNVFKKASHIVPAIIINLFSSFFPEYQATILTITNVYIMLIVVFVLFAILNALEDIYNTTKHAKNKPIRGFVQVIKILVSIIAAIIIISNLIGKSPILILSGLGALSAVLIIVFKDSILGFVAGIQIATNDMLRVGDWIEMPKYNADGDVIEISLNTIKVANFDRTITTIPAYALISDSFKNWRGMQEAGGRRIKRSLFIDVDSISFLTPDMIIKLKRVDIFKDYLEQREREINESNKNKNVDTSVAINGRRLTNIGVFRAYIEHYLKNNDKIHKEMICMVRQLAPTPQGVPLELYAFTNDTNWINYERIQSDIFDHLLTVAKEFGLKIYQEPSGNDLKEGLFKKS